MAMVTAPPIINNNKNPTSSSTHQNVYLFDWWLFKTQVDVNGKRLAITGFKYRGSKNPQGFSSAPIVKKYDSGTLQTADGVVVHIEGTINKIRSLNNGISSEVCNHFRFGFPYDWDDLRYHCGEDSMSTSTSYLSNDRDNKKEGGTNANLLRKKFKDASKDTVLQVAAECLGQFDVELQKTEDALAKNSVGRAEVVSSTSRGRMVSIKKSLGPLEARRSSRLRNTKKRTDDGQNIKTNKSTLVSLESDLVTENKIHCESGVEDVRGSPFTRPHEKSNSLDDVNLTGMKTSPNDGPKISEINAFCDSDSTRADAFGHDIDSDNPSVALQAAAECLGQFDVELQKTEDALDKNSVGRAEVVSSTSHGRMDGTKKSLGPNEARRSSRLRNTKKRTDGGQNIKTNKSTLVSLKSDLVTEDEIHCESGVEDVRGSPFTRPHEKSNSLDDVNLTGMKGKPILTSPNDGPKISEINAFCDNDSTRADAFGHGIDNDNPSAVNMAALAETPNGVGGTEDFSSTSCGKIDGNTQSISLFEARRSSRLMNMKKGTDNRCKTRKNEGIHMSLGMHCESGEKDVGGSLFNGPHEKTNCLDDVNLTEGKTSLRNDGSKISEKHPNCCGDTTQGDALGCDINSVNPPEINMAALVETPDRYLKRLSRKDLVENSGGEYLSRCFSKKVTPCSKRDSMKKYTFEARATNRMKVVEKGINNETCKSHKTLANVKNDMTMSAGKMDTGDNKLGTSRRKTKRRLDYITEVSTPPISRSKKKKLSLLSPEESSCKKSGSGRLIVPSLDYWRNQQVFYDLDRGVAGVLNGLPLTESCTGNFSETSRKLKKFL